MVILERFRDKMAGARLERRATNHCQGASIDAAGLTIDTCRRAAANYKIAEPRSDLQVAAWWMRRKARRSGLAATVCTYRLAHSL